MTIYQLLEYDNPEMLEKFTDTELNEFFRPYLEVTRPELAKLSSVNNGTIRHSSSSLRNQKAQQELELAKRMEMVKALAKERGIKL